MAWVAYAAYTIMAGAAVYGATEQKKSGDEAANIGRENAAREREEAAEASRKLKLKQESILAETRARAGASGLSAKSETVGTYLEEMEKNFKEEQDWIKKSGASAAAIQAKQGEYQQQVATANMWGTISSTAGRFT